MKIRIISLTFAFLFVVTALRATTYFPTPISNQVSSAYGVVQGVYQGMSYKKEFGEVITVFNFGVEKYIGLRKNEILNRNSFLVSTPGGIWNGINYNIPGSPSFKKGERVVLLINKSKRGYSLQNLALGKYSIYKQEGALYLKSSVFPGHSTLGKINYDSFLKIAKEKFNTEFVSFKETPSYYTTDKNEYISFKNKVQEKRETRVPASIEEKLPIEKTPGFFWLFILLIIVTIYSVFIIKRR